MFDYAPVNEILMFEPGESNVNCVPVTIVNDIMLEDTEIFRISVSSFDPDVDLDQNSITTVIIRDDDSKMSHLYLITNKLILYHLCLQVLVWAFPQLHIV